MKKSKLTLLLFLLILRHSLTQVTVTPVLNMTNPLLSQANILIKSEVRDHSYISCGKSASSSSPSCTEISSDSRTGPYTSSPIESFPVGVGTILHAVSVYDKGRQFIYMTEDTGSSIKIHVLEASFYYYKLTELPYPAPIHVSTPRNSIQMKTCKYNKNYVFFILSDNSSPAKTVVYNYNRALNSFQDYGFSSYNYISIGCSHHSNKIILASRETRIIYLDYISNDAPTVYLWEIALISRTVIDQGGVQFSEDDLNIFWGSFFQFKFGEPQRG